MKTLLDIQDWNFNWRRISIFSRISVALPRAIRLDVRRFTGTTRRGITNNRASPPVRVTSGETNRKTEIELALTLIAVPHWQADYRVLRCSAIANAEAGAKRWRKQRIFADPSLLAVRFRRCCRNGAAGALLALGSVLHPGIVVRDVDGVRGGNRWKVEKGHLAAYWFL